MVARKPRLEEGLYVATTTGVVRVKGVMYRYIRGKTIVTHDDPLLRAVPGSFAPMNLNGPEVMAL